MLVLGLAAASASELVYRPINPSFGGNPFNSSHLQSLASTQNQHLPSRTSTSRSPTSSQADLFVRNLQSRLLSGLAAQVSDAIFGENAAEEGSVIFGETEVTFFRGVEFINLTLSDPESGVTDIQIPVLQVE